MFRSAPPPIVASVVTLESVIATDGTTATSPPAAPVFACVAIASDVVAAMVTLCPPLSVPISSARVTSSTSATATDAPIPTDPAVTPEAPIETPPPLPSLLAPLLPLPLESLGGWTALPSAAACASVSADVASVKRPPAWIVTLSATVASDVVVARLMPTAAATDTPPSDVDAEGVPVPPVPWPPLLVEVVSAKPRCCATWSSTPLPLAPPDDSPGAPAADACALAELSDEPSALIVTSPPAVRSRSRVAVLL